MSQSVYQVLTKRIDQFYLELKRDNPFFKRIFSGEVTADECAAFTRNLQYLLVQTPLHFDSVIRSANDKGHKKLARYFKAKIHEEVDHDKWAEDDLKTIKSKFAIKEEGLGVLPEMKEFVREKERMIEQDPFQYFVYVLFAEYLTVISGSECLAAVQKATGITPSMMSVVEKHAELDKDHVHDWEIVSRQVGIDPQKAPYYLKTLEEIMKGYDLHTAALSRGRGRAAAA